MKQLRVCRFASFVDCTLAPTWMINNSRSSIVWGRACIHKAEMSDFDGSYAQLRLVVTSGRFRMVRRMLMAVGYPREVISKFG
eukprot:1317014-Amphidinium_carterae.1